MPPMNSNLSKQAQQAINRDTASASGLPNHAYTSETFFKLAEEGRAELPMEAVTPTRDA